MWCAAGFGARTNVTFNISLRTDANCTWFFSPTIYPSYASNLGEGLEKLNNIDIFQIFERLNADDNSVDTNNCFSISNKPNLILLLISLLRPFMELYFFGVTVDAYCVRVDRFRSDVVKELVK